MTLEREVKVLQEKNNDITEQFNNDKKTFSFENEKLKRKCKQLEKEIVDYKNMLDTKTKENKDLQDNIQLIQKINDESTKLIEDLKVNFEKEKTSFDKEIFKKDTDLRSMENQNEEYLRSLNKQRINIEELEMEKNAFEGFIIQKNKEFLDLEDEFKELQTDNYKLNTNLKEKDLENKNVNHN